MIFAHLLSIPGNANCALGDKGIFDAELICQKVAEIFKLNKQQILPFSTGVIGEYLPVDEMISSLKGLKKTCWNDFAKAICTTDTRTKIASRQFVANGQTITITGVAKGSGMIEPNMATMLSFIATDAKVSDMKTALRNSVSQSFNRICVDGEAVNQRCCLFWLPLRNI